MWRVRARRIRDRQWKLMERMIEHGTLWICPWNKRRLPESEDEYRSCLLGWNEMAEWFTRHSDWFEIGEWDDDRYAYPYRLTDAGSQALTERHKYDREPVYGGLVEPGWMAIPASLEG